jgi:hypothetical protein
MENARFGQPAVGELTQMVPGEAVAWLAQTEIGIGGAGNRSPYPDAARDRNEASFSQIERVGI